MYNAAPYTDQCRVPFLAIAGVGSAGRTTYFFNTTTGVLVRSGCFFGTLAQFRAKVRLDEASGDSRTKTLQYLGMANIAAVTFAPSEVEP